MAHPGRRTGRGDHRRPAVEAAEDQEPCSGEDDHHGQQPHDRCDPGAPFAGQISPARGGAAHRVAWRAEREAAAARAGGGTAAGEQQWEVRGVIRATLPELSVVVVTHEDIPGYMPSMTMGFRTAAPEIHDSVRVGDAVRFTLRGTPPNVVITAIRAANP